MQNICTFKRRAVFAAIFPYLAILQLRISIAHEVASRSHNPAKCEPLTIPLCKSLPYNKTVVPNLLNHETQEEAGYDVHQFYAIVKIGCSPHMQNFLCALYAPTCSYSDLAHPPCRSLCARARAGCEPVMVTFGFTWPQNLECERFPETECIIDGTNITRQHNPIENGIESNDVEVNQTPKLVSVKYDPTWESLDARPLPSWYDRSKVGIFIHWGVYSVPALDTWFWWSWQGSKTPKLVEYMKRNYRPGFSYQEFAPKFTAEFYNATQWVELFKKAGAKYVVLTSKHHEGYTLWPSKHSFSWNSMEVGPHRDLVGEFADAVKNNSELRFGLYHSLYEWFNPLWLSDKNNSLESQDFVNFKVMPELYDLVNTYKPEILWSDGDWDAVSKYWKSKDFLAWLYNDSPVKETVATNDRWGAETLCTHGGYYTCQDRFNPGVLQPHKWENCLTLDRDNWGFRQDATIQDYLTHEELIGTLVETVACGGNFLINVGPTKEGLIVPIQQERILQMGEWLEVNGEAIYDTVPWIVQNDTLTSGIWYTSRPAEKKVYAITLNWPSTNLLRLQSVTPGNVSSVEVLGWTGAQQWSPLDPTGIQVTLPPLEKSQSKWAWTIVVNTV